MQSAHYSDIGTTDLVSSTLTFRDDEQSESSSSIINQFKDESELREFMKRYEDEKAQEAEEGEEKNLYPQHSCIYCGVSNPSCVVKCNTCSKWFCNNKTSISLDSTSSTLNNKKINTSSHIITHLVMSKHNTISLHKDSDFGDTTLECYNCGNKNLFVLGFVSSTQSSVVVILCRLPCAQLKDSNWDTQEWQSLIDDRQLLPWIAEIPNDEDLINSRPISGLQISKLESRWRIDKDATLNDIDKPEEEEEEVIPILVRYEDGYQYQRSFAPLIQLEANYDKSLKESQALNHISIKWGLSLNNRHLVSFNFSTFNSSSLKISIGDQMKIRYSGSDLNEPWEQIGTIIKTPNSISSADESFTLELKNYDYDNELIKKKRQLPPPTHLTTNFTAEYIWKGISFERMQNALLEFATNEKSVSSYLYHSLLGQPVDDIEFDIELPKKFSIDGFAQLNVSQASAVRQVLKKPLSLIQGPPGTGKTVTSATIVYHLHKIYKEKVLVCAPSNVAVDHLAEKLGDLGLKVVRIVAKTREEVETQNLKYSLSELVKKSSKGQLKKLIRLKDEIGELTDKDFYLYKKLSKELEESILKKSDIICCTCSGAADNRLDGMKFRSILIDESTQASESETLIPIVKGARQVILVGDHQQLGPVILNSKSADAGLRQSLFERLIILNHIPIRLEVQYRMNPCLSEFPSNLFYDGALQNGVTSEMRSIKNSLFPWPVKENPMIFWSVNGKEEISSSGTSYLNRVEAYSCEKLVTRLLNDGINPEQIGIITPYEGQRAYLVNYLQYNGSLSDKSKYLDLEIASVDSFQGREKDFIILSCVRSNEQQLIGFLKDERRLNVALTRAKYGLIIVGNSRGLVKDRLWNLLFLHFREKGCFVEGTLDNLQMCSLALNIPGKNRFNNNNNNNRSSNLTPSSYASSLRSFDTQSMASYASTTRGNNRNKTNWPSFVDAYAYGNNQTRRRQADLQSISGSHDYYQSDNDLHSQSASRLTSRRSSFASSTSSSVIVTDSESQFGLSDEEINENGNNFDDDNKTENGEIDDELTKKLTSSFASQFTF